MFDTPFFQGIEAWNAGQLAAAQGMTPDQCPFPDGYQRQQWHRGYDYEKQNPSPMSRRVRAIGKD